MSSFTEFPNIKLIDKKRGLWRLETSFKYHVGSKESKEVIIVPKGFVSDGTSIPRFVWPIVGHPMGEYAQAAFLHDYLYSTQIRSRKFSDFIFYEAMQVLKVSFWKRWTMYHAVRSFGWHPWGIHTRRNIKNSNS